MSINNSTLEIIRYVRGKLSVLDHLALPTNLQYLPISNVKEARKAIKSKQVRGASTITVVSCLSLIVEFFHQALNDKRTMRCEIERDLNYLMVTIPNKNVIFAARNLISYANSLNENAFISAIVMKERFILCVEHMLQSHIKDNIAMGNFGAETILMQNTDNDLRILTICNTGFSPVTGDCSILTIMRSLSLTNKISHVYCTETRPYSKCACLTIYELNRNNICFTIILDSMVAALMKTRKITAVVAGADMVTYNGDTANRIGTYQLAVVANYHKVPFYVAAPLTSVYLTIKNGNCFLLKEKPENDVILVGRDEKTAREMYCWNPPFDITPASLITGIITEKGVFRPNKLKNIFV